MSFFETIPSFCIYGALVIFALIWLISVIVTVADKHLAKVGGRRVPERTLMLLGLFGGALPMYVTMKKIRHKTLHNKFMIGLPLIILLHILLLAGAVWLLTKSR